MPRVRCWASTGEAQRGIVTRVNVADDRLAEAQWLFDRNEVLYWSRNSEERILQNFPGHFPGNPLEDLHLPDPRPQSKPELEERQEYARGGIRDPIMGDIPLLDPQEPQEIRTQAAQPRRDRQHLHYETFAGLGLGHIPLRPQHWGQEGPQGPQVPQDPPEPEGQDYPELDLTGIITETDMSELLPPFKIDYETIEEVKLRLNNTVILLKDKPFFVYRASNTRRGFMLVLEDIHGDRRNFAFSRLQNARSARPGYISWKGSVCYLLRRPARINQQGMSSDNTMLVPVGQHMGKGMTIRTKDLLEVLGYRKPKKYSQRLVEDLLDHTVPAFRLSNAVAIYRRDDEKDHHRKIWVEYKGRTLAPVKDSMVLLKDLDKSLPWIIADLAAVDIRVV